MKNKIFDKISNFFRNPTYQHSKNEIESIEKTPVTEEFERCVICGRLTSVPISMPVDCRENYEIGIGQICSESAKNEREAKPFGNKLTTEQILQAVEQCRKESKK